jgi:hypothetical protein
VATTRAVRIPRARADSDRPAPDETTVASGSSLPASGRVDRRRNQAGTERAFRLTLIYVVTLVVLYVVFVLLDRSAPGGTSTAVQTGLLYFSAIAVALGVGGALVALGPAPRAIELTTDSLVVIEWYGRRRTFPPLAEVQRSVVRRYPASFLSSRAVEAVELGTPAGGRRTYQLEVGLLPSAGAAGVPPGA